MAGPVRLVRSRSNSVSSITSNTTQQLAYCSLEGKESLLWSLHECNLKILHNIYVRISAERQDQKDFADVVENLKDEVIRLRLWGKEVDVKTMLVVERSRELRSAVVILLQEIASILLNRACIRPPPSWCSHQYQKLRELHDRVRTMTNIQTYQGQHDGLDVGIASPNLRLFDLEELILDLRCCTSTLMDLVPAIEHTKDVLTQYVSHHNISRVQQMSTSALQAQSARNDKTEMKAPKKTEEPRQRIVGPELQRPSSDTSSTVPPTHTIDNVVASTPIIDLEPPGSPLPYHMNEMIVCTCGGIQFDSCLCGLANNDAAAPAVPDDTVSMLSPESSQFNVVIEHMANYVTEINLPASNKYIDTNDTMARPSTVQAHIEDIYTPGDRLSLHKRRAPREYGFVCNESGCNEVFHRQCDLNRHHRTGHPNNKPHICPICDRGFLYPKDLRRHSRQHSDPSSSIVTFRCDHPDCSNLDGFSRKDNLKRHQRRQHAKE